VLGYVNKSSEEADTDFFAYILVVMDHLISTFLEKNHKFLKNVLTPSLPSLLVQISCYCMMQRKTHEEDARTQTRSMAQLYSLVATLFEDRPDAALGFWVRFPPLKFCYCRCR